MSYAILLTDITEKAAIETLQHLNEYKDKIIASISHELRTPLNGILGMLQAAIEQNKTPGIETFLKNCKSCAYLLLHFVNSVLDMNKIKSDKLRLDEGWFDIKEMLEEIESLYAFQASSKNLSFDIFNDFGSGEIYTDKLRLMRILINLVNNAFKFTSQGSVRVRISRDDNSETHLVFSVYDTGVGIKPDTLKRLFNMFSQVNTDKVTNSEGIGFGLAVSRDLVQLLNRDQQEKIYIDSKVDNGSIFKFRIPCLPKKVVGSNNGIVETNADVDQFETKVPLESVKSFTNIPKHYDFSKYLKSSHILSVTTSTNKSMKKRCLIVDDNPFNLYAVTHVFEKFDLEVVTALSGQKAIEILEQQHLDIIFMDIQMPVMDGIETTKVILEKIEQGKIKKTPIVALTANGDFNKQEFLNAGMSDYLGKPFKEEQLAAILDMWTG